MCIRTGAEKVILLIGVGIVFIANICSGEVFAQQKLVTFEDIKTISPSAKNDFAQTIVDAEESLKSAGISTRLRMAHFLAQVMTETGGLERIDENMNYSYEVLIRVFSRSRLPEEKAHQIARKPVEIANWVYGNILGNKGRHTNDGWMYRGSGFIQLTGRANFRDRGREAGLKLEESPELARQASEGMTAAVAYWKARGINSAADDHDLKRVRVLVNGPAAHGFEQSRVWFGRVWNRALKAKGAAGYEAGEELVSNEVIDEQSLFDEILKNNGTLPADAFESGADKDLTRSAGLKKYQREAGLPETGVLDEATQSALLDPREWRHREMVDLVPTQRTDMQERSVAFLLPGAIGVATAERLGPSQGTGVTVADPSISPSETTALATARAIFSAYETGPSSPPDGFVPFSVIGSDDRKSIEVTTTFPERAIVQILFEAQGGARYLCTGSMIAKDTVLTAAHCLHSGTSSGQIYSNFVVTPGRNGGAAPFGSCRGRQIYLLEGWTTSLTPDETKNFDLGALKLDCNVGEATGWLGVRPLEDKDAQLKTIVQGYAGDKAPAGKQWYSEDRLRLLWTLKGFYQNDTFGGTSGAPVFAIDTKNFVIGVHTNGRHGEISPWAVHNAFTRITPARIGLIRSWTQ